MQSRCFVLAASALVAAALAGCGSVRGPQDMDGPACAGNSVAACGAGCVACEVSSARAMPTCDGNACGSVCKGGASRCSDGSCSQVVFDFQAGSLDGVTAPTAGPALAVRNFNGALALAVDTMELNQGELTFKIPVCLSGVLDVKSKMFKMQVFFQGGGSTMGMQYYVQVSVPSPQTGAFIGSSGFEAQQWTPFEAPLSASQFSATTSEITIQLGSYGASFAGTVWFDDIRIE
jgi:hypothetical protein